ncbi:MAG: MgtC/SapB family protein, partial [Bacteroidales bacterium]|nr:MgtC/SapB family protein [Bacteroidales bacterium]
AGVIIFQKNVVRGVTTAAGLWVAAAIGLASGAGMYALAIAATLMTIICLETMHFITRRFGEKSLMITISHISSDKLAGVLDSLRKANFEIDSFSYSEGSATVHLHLSQRGYQKALSRILEITRGLDIEIS